MKLKQAYASGVSEVEFDDRKIKYNSPKRHGKNPVSYGNRIRPK